jgi:hypothetical protein
MSYPSLVISNSVVEPEAKPRPSAKTRVRHGKTLVIIGTLVAFLGVAIYIAKMMIGELNHEPVSYPTEGLMTIGAGLAIYLIGAFKYLNAVMDLDPSDDTF